MDLHHNLFYSYRGPTTDDADRDQQLENNLTKALINTLALGGEAVWSPFLAELGIRAKPQPFLLQRRDIPGGAANKRHRILLGITKHKCAWSSQTKSPRNEITELGKAPSSSTPQRSTVMASEDRLRGALFGLAIGDALGAAVEFKSPGTFKYVDGFRAGGPHGLNPSEWTDDTSMALALADSIAQVGWDLNDRFAAYRRTWVVYETVSLFLFQ